MAAVGYLDERRLYVEQVSSYWRRRFDSALPGDRLTESGYADCAALRIEADRTLQRVAAHGWPWTWMLKVDPAWVRIVPHWSEMTKAFEAQCAESIERHMAWVERTRE